MTGDKLLRPPKSSHADRPFRVEFPIQSDKQAVENNAIYQQQIGPIVGLNHVEPVAVHQELPAEAMMEPVLPNGPAPAFDVFAPVEHFEFADFVGIDRIEAGTCA